MLPILQIGPLALPVYPISLLLAFWVGLALSARAARRLGLDGDHIWNAGLYGLLAAIIVGRLGHVIAFWPAYRLQPLDIVGLNAQAFLWGPGLLAGVIVAAWYIHRHKLPWVTVLDAVAPGVLVGLVIASLGALLAGNDVGAPANLPWAVELWGVSRHPVQLYARAGRADYAGGRVARVAQTVSSRHGGAVRTAWLGADDLAHRTVSYGEFYRRGWHQAMADDRLGRRLGGLVGFAAPGDGQAIARGRSRVLNPSLADDQSRHRPSG